MTEAMPFLQKYDITFLRPPTIRRPLFFEEIALRCMHAPQARTLRSVRRVFWHAHVAPKND